MASAQFINKRDPADTGDLDGTVALAIRSDDNTPSGKSIASCVMEISGGSGIES